MVPSCLLHSLLMPFIEVRVIIHIVGPSFRAGVSVNPDLLALSMLLMMLALLLSKSVSDSMSVLRLLSDHSSLGSPIVKLLESHSSGLLWSHRRVVCQVLVETMWRVSSVLSFIHSLK